MIIHPEVWMQWAEGLFHKNKIENPNPDKLEITNPKFQIANKS